MKECDVWGLVKLLGHIETARLGVKPWLESEDRDELVPAEGLSLYVEGIVPLAAHFAEKLGLQSTYDRVWLGGGAFYLISKSLTWQELANELQVLRQSIEADLEKHLFVQIPYEKTELFNRMKTDWAVILNAIPSAREDVEEALSCYAFERNTASVFHSMRIAEWGLRAFCRHLGLKQVKKTVKNGVPIFVPVEFAMWDQIINQLRPRAQSKIDATKNRASKQAKQEFYFSVLAEIDGFKDAWRNHVMHTRRSYSAEDAIAVLTHVLRFMKNLVSHGAVKA
jgi:hypothetical protein